MLCAWVALSCTETSVTLPSFAHISRWFTEFLGKIHAESLRFSRVSTRTRLFRLKPLSVVISCVPEYTFRKAVIIVNLFDMCVCVCERTYFRLWAYTSCQRKIRWKSINSLTGTRGYLPQTKRQVNITNAFRIQFRSIEPKRAQQIHKIYHFSLPPFLPAHPLPPSQNHEKHVFFRSCQELITSKQIIKWTEKFDSSCKSTAPPPPSTPLPPYCHPQTNMNLVENRFEVIWKFLSQLWQCQQRIECVCVCVCLFVGRKCIISRICMCSMPLAHWYGNVVFSMIKNSFSNYRHSFH